jgi:hypothetical protein
VRSEEGDGNLVGKVGVGSEGHKSDCDSVTADVEGNPCVLTTTHWTKIPGGKW